MGEGEEGGNENEHESEKKTREIEAERRIENTDDLSCEFQSCHCLLE